MWHSHTYLYMCTALCTWNDSAFRLKSHLFFLSSIEIYIYILSLLSTHCVCVCGVVWCVLTSLHFIPNFNYMIVFILLLKGRWCIRIIFCKRGKDCLNAVSKNSAIFSVKFLRTVGLSLKVRINGVQALRIQWPTPLSILDITTCAWICQHLCVHKWPQTCTHMCVHMHGYTNICLHSYIHVCMYE